LIRTILSAAGVNGTVAWTHASLLLDCCCPDRDHKTAHVELPVDAISTDSVPMFEPCMWYQNSITKLEPAAINGTTSTTNSSLKWLDASVYM
jgi:hypothetical protein